MNLGFLVPAFLLGLVAIAIPVWVHLRNRPRTQTVAFPSLMFLRRIPYRTVQKQRIRHRWLLAMRALAFAMLVFAFARPFLGGVGLAGTVTVGAVERVILLDTSWSMSYGSRFRRAIAQAQQRLQQHGPGDRVSLILFDTQATVLVNSEPTPERARAALAAAAPGAASTDLAVGVQAAAKILSGSSLPRREVVLISDFQRPAWRGDAELQLPPGTALEPVAIQGDVDNVSISTVNLRRQLSADGAESVLVSVRLSRQGGTEPRGLPVQLHLSGVPEQTVRVQLQPNASARVDFRPVSLPTPGLRGSVTVPEDALVGDDTFHFVVPSGGAVDVLVLENPQAGPADSLYLVRALRLGTRPAFRVRRQALADLAPGDLEDHDVVVLNDVGTIDAGTAETLRRFVQAGGGVVVSLGELTPAGTTGLLPWQVGAAGDRSVELGATLAYVDTTHPALEVFAGADAGDFSRARFFRYHATVPEPQSGVMARFDDGVPALVELPMGSGRILVWMSTLDTYWNDLPLQPIYLPLVHELIKYAAAYRQPPAWLPAGRPLSARQLLAAVDGGEPESATAIRVDGDTLSGSRDSTHLGVRLAPGFHRLAWRDPAGTEHRGTVAIDLDRTEADLTPLDPEEVAAAVVWRGGGRVLATEQPSATSNRVERRQSLWWYLLVVAALLLVSEAALSNRLSSRAS